MRPEDQWMGRALELARLGLGSTGSNPLVGAVLVHESRVLAEGWHKEAGGAHAEVECLRAFGDGASPAGAIMYVSLEPCSHHGRTPPCADLLIARGLKHVVVAHADPFPEVAGRGLQRLRDAGVEVTVGISEAEARWTNRRFLTSVEAQRPYVVLKWARTADGFLDRHPRGGREVHRISSPTTDVLVHRWRSEEQAILVGSTTVLNDDPSLTVRHVGGRSPLRVVLDREGLTPDHSQVFDGSKPTLLFTALHKTLHNVEQCLLGQGVDPLVGILSELHRRGIRSVLVEGGARLLNHFMHRGTWDEARVIQGTAHFGAGTLAPAMPHTPARSFMVDQDRVYLHINPASPALASGLPQDTWPW